MKRHPTREKRPPGQIITQTIQAKHTFFRENATVYFPSTVIRQTIEKCPSSYISLDHSCAPLTSDHQLCFSAHHLSPILRDFTQDPLEVISKILSCTATRQCPLYITQPKFYQNFFPATHFYALNYTVNYLPVNWPLNWPSWYTALHQFFSPNNVHDPSRNLNNVAATFNLLVVSFLEHIVQATHSTYSLSNSCLK